MCDNPGLSVHGVQFMKHFLVDIRYTASMEMVDAVVGSHREFLQEGYDSGMLLMSGPRNPKTGGLVIARANDIEAVREYFQRDPYRLAGVAQHDIIEFNPVKRQPFMNEWIEGR